MTSRPAEHLGRLLSKIAGAPRTTLDWSIGSGPWFGNIIGILELDSAGATCRFEQARASGTVGSRLEPVDEHRLA